MKKRVLLTALFVIMLSQAAFAGIREELKSDDIVYLYENASSYYVSEKYNDAVKLCNRGIFLEPQNQKFYTLKILSLTSSGKIKERNKTVEEAVKLFPDSAAMNSYQGRICYENGNFEEAVKYLKKAIGISPNSDDYHILGLSYGELKEHEKAYKCLVKEVELTPVFKNRYNHLSDAGTSLKNGDYRRAYTMADEVLLVEPKYYYPYKLKAMAALYMHEPADALINIDKAIKYYGDVYPISLYGIRENILYSLAYIDGGKVNKKYSKEFLKDFSEITNHYAKQQFDLLYPDENTEGDTLINYIDSMAEYIVKSASEHECKINTLISMMNSNAIKSRRYSNMCYYKLYATAMKLSIYSGDEDPENSIKRTQKRLNEFKRKTRIAGDIYQRDFADYLFCKLCGNEEKADDLIKIIVNKRDIQKVYDYRALYEDDIDEILDFVNKFEI